MVTAAWFFATTESDSFFAAIPISVLTVLLLSPRAWTKPQNKKAQYIVQHSNYGMS